MGVVLFAGCSSGTSSTPSSSASTPSSASSSFAPEELELDDSYQNIIIDVRSPAAYETGHLEGAVNLPYLQTDLFNNVLVTLGKGETYVIYGGGKANSAEALKSFELINLNAADFGTLEEAAKETGLPIVK